MSIATEITRLTNAKASIKSAIEAKGVTVPSSTTLDGYATLIGNIQTGGGGATLTPTAGDYPVVCNGGIGGGGNGLTNTNISVTIPVSGTYRFKWCAFRRSTGNYTWSSRLYRKRGSTTSAIGTENSSWTSTYYQTNSQDIAVEAGDIIYVYVAGRSSSYSWGGMLMACVNQKMWTNGQ